MRWDNRSWMVDILKDKAERIVIPKASKVGVSEIMFIKMMMWAIEGKSGMYVLPTDPVRNRLVSTRIDPIIGAAALYRNNCSVGRKQTDNKSLKTLFGSHWNFVGSRSPENFYEFDADVLIFDEYDKCKLSNLSLAMDRTGSAAADMWCKIGNPTISDFGIDAEYKLTNMSKWLLKCTHCNEWQQLQWFDNFVMQDDDGQWKLRDTDFLSLSLSQSDACGLDASPICTHCNKPLDRLAQGEWVAEHPSIPEHGYMADRLFGAPGNDHDPARAIINETFKLWCRIQGNPTELQTFYNNRLGIPFETDGSKITMNLLGACASNSLMPTKMIDGVTCTAGVDVNYPMLHTQISNWDGNKGKWCKVFVGAVRHWSELDALCKRFNVTRGVVDAMPELHATEDWCKDHAGWYRCFYDKPDTATKLVDVKHAEKKIDCNRTAVCDNAFQNIVNRHMELPMNWRSLDHGDFVKQMLAPTRVYDEDKARFIWDEGNNADHHFHANVYDTLAQSLVASGSLIEVL